MASRATFCSAHHRVSSSHDYDLCHGMDKPLQGDRLFYLMGQHADGGLVLSPITWTKPRYQRCEGGSVARSPESSRHLLVQPLYVSDSSPAGGRQRGNEERDVLYVADKRGSIRRTPATAHRRGKYARGGRAQETTGCNIHRNTSKGGVDSNWHFTVDVKDCSDVDVSTDGHKLTVVGIGYNYHSNYIKSVCYETILPSHVREDMLIAKVGKGRLTVVQRLVTDDLIFPIQVQEKRESVAEKKEQQHQEQENRESVAEKKEQQHQEQEKRESVAEKKEQQHQQQE